MTCEMMREALLQAELPELRREGDGPVAVHLRGCASCRRDADRILAATSQLGKVVRERRRRPWVVVVPIAAAAALALLLLPRTKAPGVPILDTLRPVPPAGVVAAAPAPGPGPLRRTAPGHRFEPVALSPVAFEPTSILPSPREDEERKRPRVLPTSDPSITVLWFD
jgi:hypothetical protein